MLFALKGSSNTTTAYPCSPSTAGSISIDNATVPGLWNEAYPGCSAGGSLYIPIPMSDLGQQHVATMFDPGPLACQATHLGASYTAHVHYTITLDLQ
jgi:hypothetical protein